MAAKYLIIARELEHQLRLGLEEGQRLPTEAALCRQYGVSRQTVRSALGVLEEKGLILRRQGSGSYPTQAKSSRQIAVVLADNELPQPHTLTAAERLERCVYLRQRDAVRAVWSAGKKVYTAE